MVTEASRNRTARLGWMILALWAMLAGSAGWMTYAAQRAPARAQALPSWKAAAQPKGLGKPLVGAQFPTVDLRRINPYTLPKTASGQGVGAQTAVGSLAVSVPAPPQAPPPYFDLTTIPRPPQVGDSTASFDQHPVYSTDQRFIYFDSNRGDVNGATVGGRFHIWQMTSDGNSVFQLTGTTTSGVRADEVNGDQLFPAVNAAGTFLAFLHRPNANVPFQLYVIDLVRGTRTQLTGILNQRDVFGNLVNFVNLGRPAWSAGGQLAFSAQNGNTANDRPNVWVIDPSTRVSRNVTNLQPGSLLDAIEPTWRRVGSEDRITFASTASSTGAGGGTLNAATARNGLHWLWEVRILSPTSAQFTRLTSAPNADDREPAWNKSSGSVYNGALAFSSRGRNSPTNYDIHWIPATEGPALATPTPEVFGTTNVQTLLTPDNDPNVPIAFRNQTDETSPSWSSGASGVERLAHQANRIQVVVPPPPGSPVGTPSSVELRPSANNLDIWTADVADVNPPTLLPVDAAQGVIVDIRSQQTNAQLGATGDRFTIRARLQDLNSGISSVWLQIKDPDSSTQDAEGKEHKLYGYNDTAGGFSPGPPPVFTTDTTFDGRKQGSPRGQTHKLHQQIEFDCEGVRADSAGGLPQFYRGAAVNPATGTVTQRFDALQVIPPGGSAFSSAIQYSNDSPMVEVPTYLPGVDDSVAWSGNTFPPANDGRWLQLTDPDGDGIFTATWDSPIVPSDYYVDVIAYDQSHDPVNPANQSNWIIYDNVGGFSTQPLISVKQGLAVMDHALGQKWLRGLRGNFRPFPSWRFGTESEVIDEPDANQRDPGHPLRPRQTSVYDPASPCSPPPTFNFTNIPVEDFTTLAPGSATFPGFPTPIPWTKNADRSGGGFGIENNWALAMPMFGGPEQIAREPVVGGNLNLADTQQMAIACGGIIGDIYPHYGVDVWRILSKGPVPSDVLDRYLPTVEAQPGDINDSAAARRAQIVSRRFVLWHAPYTGDVYTGAGTILDLNAQNRLKAFVEAKQAPRADLPAFPQGVPQGGRLLIDGSDIAWALTGDVPNQNATAQPFLRDVLDAAYLGDSLGQETTAAATTVLADLLTKDVFGTGVGGSGFTPNGRGNCPTGTADITPDTLYTPFALPPFPSGAYNGDRDDGYPSTGIAQGVFPAGTAWSLMDGIAPLPDNPATPAVEGRGSQAIFDGRMIAREDATTKAKVVYCSFGLHIMGRFYDAGGDPACTLDPPNRNPDDYANELYQLNYKAKIGHNIGCWFTSASLTGQIVDVGNQTVPGAFVVAKSPQTNQVIGTALSDSEGRYLINGLPPGVWDVEVTSPGFVSFSKPDANFGHGLQQQTVDVRLTHAPPGVLTGRVVDQFGNPVAGANVLATINASSLFKGQRTFSGVTDINGVYRIDPIETGQYFVTVEPPFPTGTGLPITSLPSSVPYPRVADITTANVTSGVDFQMGAAPAALKVVVHETVAGVRNGVKVQGAAVNLVQTAGGSANLQGITDANGEVNFGTLQPGIYDYSVAEALHTTATGQILIPRDAPVKDIDLEKDTTPVQEVRGQVKLAVGGTLLDASSGLVVRAEQGGSLRGSTPVINPTGSPQQFNFEFTGQNRLKEGTYDFVVTDPRFGTGRANGVVVSANTPLVQIVLPGTPGLISGFVKRQDNGSPVAGANVSITSQSNPNFILSLTTDATGRYQTTSTVQPGIYDVRASHPLFQPGQQLNVAVSGNTAVADILLGTAPPTTISGTIFSAVGSPRPVVGGMTVELLKSDGVTPVPGVAAVISAGTESGSPPANYTLTNVPAGSSYVVRVSGSGFRTTSRVTPAVSGPVTRFDFVLDAQFTFTPGLWLVSPPATYADNSPNVFGNPPGFNAAKWLPVPTGNMDGSWLDVGNVYPPRSPILAGYDPLRVVAGYGQFVRITRQQAFTTPGGVIPDRNLQYPVEVLAGWSLIGSGRDVRVDFGSIRVLRSTGEELSMNEAISRGIVFNNLIGWSGATYVHNQRFLEPFRAYFLRTGEGVKLLMPPTQQTAAVQPAKRLARSSFLQRWLAEAELEREGIVSRAQGAPSRELREAPAIRSWFQRVSQVLMPQDWPWQRRTEPVRRAAGPSGPTGGRGA